MTQIGQHPWAEAPPGRAQPQRSENTSISHHTTEFAEPPSIANTASIRCHHSNCKIVIVARLLRSPLILSKAASHARARVPVSRGVSPLPRALSRQRTLPPPLPPLLAPIPPACQCRKTLPNRTATGGGPHRHRLSLADRQSWTSLDRYSRKCGQDDGAPW